MKLSTLCFNFAIATTSLVTFNALVEPASAGKNLATQAPIAFTQSGQMINPTSSALESIVASEAQAEDQVNRINICDLFPWLPGCSGSLKETIKPNTLAGLVVPQESVTPLTPTICSLFPWLPGCSGSLKENANPNIVAGLAIPNGLNLCSLFPSLPGCSGSLKENTNSNTVVSVIPSSSILSQTLI